MIMLASMQPRTERGKLAHGDRNACRLFLLKNHAFRWLNVSLLLPPQEMDTSFGSLQQVAGAARTQADNLDDILKRSEAHRLR
jgi:hypothetical protein